MSKEKRFSFGRNWKRYLKSLTYAEIDKATGDLRQWIGDGHADHRFLDIGSGSGLSSLAACRLGFKSITSFDYDKDSVEATRRTKEKFGSGTAQWQIGQGSILDPDYINTLEKADVVYSWGVLHHTGDMWKAIDNAAGLVADKGLLYIAIYNDQGAVSSYWAYVKRTYVSSPLFIKLLMLLIFWCYFAILLFVADLVRLRNPWARHRSDRRGMKFFYDVIDWVGGYPFQVATPQKIKTHVSSLGFRLLKEKTVGFRHGCNEFLFQKQ